MCRACRTPCRDRGRATPPPRACSQSPRRRPASGPSRRSSAARSGDVGAQDLCDLDRQRADPAGARVNEHTLAGLPRGHLAQRLERGQAGQRDGRGLLEARLRAASSPPRSRRPRPARRARPCAPSPAAHRLVAGEEARHRGADLLDDAGHVAAQHDRERRPRPKRTGVPWRILKSSGLRLAARTWISTSRGPTAGAGRSSTARTSGPP